MINKYSILKNMRIVGILCVFIYTSCAPTIPKNVEYSQKLSETEALAQYADDFLKRYEGTKKNKALLAYIALFQGNMLNASYNTRILLLELDDSNNIIPHVESITNNLYIYFN